MIRRPAVFLDRDGVLVVEKSYVTEVANLEIFPYARECINKIHDAGYLAIVITNQSAIGRGMMSEETLIAMNSYLQSEIDVDSIYYCPHWYTNDALLSNYNKICDCRKPKIGLLKRAMEDYFIELDTSFFVGDRISDVLAGKNTGITTVLLESGYSTEGIDIVPDYQYKDLVEFVERGLPTRKYQVGRDENVTI